MANIIEFYIPGKYRSKSKWIPEEQRGRILEFRPRLSFVKPSVEKGAEPCAQNGAQKEVALLSSPSSERPAEKVESNHWSLTCFSSFLWFTSPKSTRAWEPAFNAIVYAPQVEATKPALLLEASVESHT
jgi:hypothetical protein